MKVIRVKSPTHGIVCAALTEEGLVISVKGWDNVTGLWFSMGKATKLEIAAFARAVAGMLDVPALATAVTDMLT